MFYLFVERTETTFYSKREFNWAFCETRALEFYMFFATSATKWLGQGGFGVCQIRGIWESRELSCFGWFWWGSGLRLFHGQSFCCVAPESGMLGWESRELSKTNLDFSLKGCFDTDPQVWVRTTDKDCEALLASEKARIYLHLFRFVNIQNWVFWESRYNDTPTRPLPPSTSKQGKAMIENYERRLRSLGGSLSKRECA